MLGNGAKLYLFGLQEDEQAQGEHGKRQLIAGIGHIFNGFLGHIHQGRIGNVFNQEESIIQECAEGIQQCVHKGHTECHDSQGFTIILFSCGFAVVFQEADTQNTNGNDTDRDPGQPGDLFLQEEISWLTWVAIGVITVGVLGVSFLENHGETTRKKNYGKTLAIVAFCMPFVYALLDAFGTFLDDAFFLIEDVANSPLVDVTEETIEDVANTSYELTFAMFALGLFIFLKAKKVKFGPIPQHKDKILAAVFETAGQFTYVYALGGVDAIAAPILSSVCVVSLVLSRIFLKEKLSWKTYAFIAVVIVGILLLAVSEEL